MHRHPDVLLSICCTERRLSTLAAVAHPHRPAHANSESPHEHTHARTLPTCSLQAQRNSLLPCKHIPRHPFVYRPAHAGCRVTSCTHACNSTHALLFCAVPDARPDTVHFSCSFSFAIRASAHESPLSLSSSLPRSPFILSPSLGCLAL